ncbi:hypothetical protein BZA70DRAFT_272960 [Myxozyma melibiosi]|uniref:Uncharacterized protein n=1 Tax=Myxozyma melibiosi TaxID=54550 RepID=A0ABR1FE43_9ASCO
MHVRTERSKEAEAGACLRLSAIALVIIFFFLQLALKPRSARQSEFPVFPYFCLFFEFRVFVSYSINLCG